MSSYTATLGPGSEQTSGCATIQIDQGRFVSHRIDLRANATDWQSESLPHELMHVVLAERFADQRIPPWADEGIAIRAESPGKRQRRLNELRQVTKMGAFYRASELVAVDRPPAARLRTAFYGQSMVLVDLLLERGTPRQLLEFVEACQRGDVENATKMVYRGETWDELATVMSDRAAPSRARSVDAPDNGALPWPPSPEVLSSR